MRLITMINNQNNLRRKNIGKQGKWSTEELKAGLEYFKELNGRYPSAREIDFFDFLPSARSIQRSYGGLEKFRKDIGFDESLTNLTRGKIRSEKAQNTYSNAVKHEESFYQYLIDLIPEVRVHEHRILRPGNVCCDFFIYTSDSEGFAVDLFYAQDLFTAREVIRIKNLRYKGLSHKVYFILVGNEGIGQEEIDTMLANRKSGISKNCEVITEASFRKKFKSLIGGL